MLVLEACKIITIISKSIIETGSYLVNTLYLYETSFLGIPYLHKSVLSRNKLFYLIFKQNRIEIKNISKEMENLVETICRLCLSSVTPENYEIIDKPVRDVLEILLPSWNLDEDKHLICNYCSTKLFAALDFKRTCLDTENCIFPYVNSEKGGLLDLQEIYSKENDSKLQILENYNICRLCMRLICGEFKHLEQLDVNMLNTYITEINFSSTKNPVICEACKEALKSHSGFLTFCLENRKDIQYDNDGISDLRFEEVEIKREGVEVKTEEFDLKPEEIYLNLEENDERYLKEEAHENNKIKCEISEPSTEKECNLEDGSQETFQPQQSQNRSDVNACDMFNSKNEVIRPVPRFNCENCSFQTAYLTCLKRHQLLHQDPSMVQMYKCNDCSFTTKRKSDLLRHKLVHRDPSEVRMYKCDECSYTAKHKLTLSIHKVKHKDPSEIQMYKCDQCSYKSRCKSNFVRHELMHRDPSEIEMYKCNKCNYQARWKSNLRDHELTHRDPSKIEMHKCEKCTFKTKSKSSLRHHKLTHRDTLEIIELQKCDECNYKTRFNSHMRNHKLTHRDPSEIQMYKCDECSYRTRKKSNLRIHKLMHRDPSEVQMYECDECSYKTRVKGNLRKHKLTHRDPSEIQMYECDECSYNTKYKDALRRHMLSHRDPSEVQMYECDECSYTTRVKGNLRKHKLTHRDPSEREVYVCEKCARQFKYKMGLKNHMLKGCVDGRGVQHKFDDRAQQILGCCVAPVKVEG